MMTVMTPLSQTRGCFAARTLVPILVPTNHGLYYLISATKEVVRRGEVSRRGKGGKEGSARARGAELLAVFYFISGLFSFPFCVCCWGPRL